MDVGKPARYVVFGASGGIGSALCRHLVDSGHHVTLAGRNEAKLAACASELGMPCRVLDASDLEAVESCLQDAVAQGDQPLDGVVNCVGSLLLKPAHLTTGPEWLGDHLAKPHIGLFQ